MSAWATIDSTEIDRERRWDSEFYVNPYNNFLEELFRQPIKWSSIQSLAKKLTSGHTPLRHDVTTGDTLFVTVECIDPLWLDINKAKRVWAYQATGELSRVQVRRGDVLITIKRRIALSCPVLKEPGLMVVNQDVVVMTPKRGLRSGFVAAVLNSRVGQYQALRHATEQMNPYLNVTALGHLLIPVLPSDVQKRIAGVVARRLNLLERFRGYWNRD